jgi:hypothetical protein
MSNAELEKASRPENTPALKLAGFVDERSLVRIANFVGGYAAGWFFAVPTAFADALDMKEGVRAYEKEKITLMTQGRLFSFKAGDTLYDTPKAYDAPWEVALRHIKLCVQVELASPASETVTKEYRTNGKVGVFEIENNRQELVDGDREIIYQRSRLQYGMVLFSVLTPNEERTQLQKWKSFEADQEEFVVFLQTGVLRTSSNKQFDFRGGLPKTPLTI